MKVGEGEGGMLELSRMGMGLLDEIVSLGALAEKSISGKVWKGFPDVFGSSTRFLKKDTLLF